MPMFFYLPLIIARGMLSVGAQAAAITDERVRDQPVRPRTQPGFDQLWLASKNPALR
jgi:hypothetical protein